MEKKEREQREKQVLSIGIVRAVKGGFTVST